MNLKNEDIKLKNFMRNLKGEFKYASLCKLK